MKKLFPIALIASAALLIVACGKKDTPSGAVGGDLLTYVPADTPYVFASLSPMPKSLIKKMEPFNQKAGEMMTGMMAGLEESMGDSDAEDGAAKSAFEFIGFIYEFMKPETMKEFGLSMESTSVIYGHGVLPVLRVSLADPDKFAPRMKQLAEERELTLIPGKAGDIAYDKIEINEDVGVLVAVADGMLIITVAPTEFSTENVATLLGDTKPAQTLAAAGTLSKLAEKYAYVSQGMGYFDFEKLSATFLDGPSGLDEALFAMTDENPMDNISAVCKAEYKSLVGIMPRIAMGYTDVSGDEMNILPVFELREDIAAAMIPIASSVPGMATDTGALMKFGFGLNLKGVRSFIEDKVAGVTENPYECAELANLNMSAMQMVQSLQQPIPPIAYNFKGVVFELNNLDGIDVTNPQVPESIDASVMLAFDNVEGLVQMGQMFVPTLGMLEIGADGSAVQIPQELLTGYNGATFVAMTDNLLAIASGKGASGKAEKMVTAKDGGEPLLMAMSFDLAGYMGLMADVQKSALEQIETPDDENAEPLAGFMDANNDMMELYAEVFDRENVQIKPTTNGIEMPVNITFK